MVRLIVPKLRRDGDGAPTSFCPASQTSARLHNWGPLTVHPSPVSLVDSLRNQLASRGCWVWLFSMRVSEAKCGYFRCAFTQEKVGGVEETAGGAVQFGDVPTPNLIGFGGEQLGSLLGRVGPLAPPVLGGPIGAQDAQHR